ncbi:MAG: glycosyltransferase [Oculatellaceae cyanobacterium bins.114]|nr:glycosyltransferase [Oculatellaceae cyanobacterium bins.114]
MKVLHVIPSIAAVRGGPSQAVLQMVKALRGQGVDAEIATTNDNGAKLLDVPLNHLTEYPVHPGTVPIRFFHRFSPTIAPLREFAFSSPLTDWLGQHINHYDLVHIHAIFSYPSTVAMTMARSRQIPYIVRPLGQLCHWSLQQGSLKKQLYLSLIERANLKGSAALHFTSTQEQAEANQLEMAFNGFVVPHGLDLPAIIPNARQKLCKQLATQSSASNPVIAPDQPIITFLSRLHPKKGLDTLITALAMLKTNSFQFVIAGTGTPDYETEIDRLLTQSGLQTRTHRIGFVEGEQKDLLLQGSDLFALTSHSENFGIAVLEALASGLPVLTTPGVALSTVVQQHNLGWVVDQCPQAIAHAIEQTLQHPEQLATKRDRARQMVQQQFTWDKIAQDLIHQYETAQWSTVNRQWSLFNGHSSIVSSQ